MINDKLFKPDSIVVLGASNNLMKPGGKIMRNLIEHKFKGQLYAVNQNEDYVQGIPSFSKAEDLPQVDLAILAVPARFCLHFVEVLVSQKETKAIIIISSGFGETGLKGKVLEQQLAAAADKYKACLIGPNCIGVMTPHHTSVFTTPIPPLT